MSDQTKITRRGLFGVLAGAVISRAARPTQGGTALLQIDGRTLASVICPRLSSEVTVEARRFRECAEYMGMTVHEYARCSEQSIPPGCAT